MAQSEVQAPHSNPNADFPYERLPRGQIRLLTILSAVNEPLKLSLTHYPYNADLAYDALSYAWNPVDGVNVPPVQISCNNSLFSISYDLSQAIQQLLALKISRVWIDCVCINQNDKEDKAWQVPLMGQYYSEANMVWVWLGPSSGHSDLAMQKIGALAAILPRLNVSQPATTQWLNENGLPDRNDSLWKGIDNLFTREWFNRLWTMQEFALAKQSTFICGDLTATGSKFASVSTELMRLGLVALTRKNRIPRVGYKDGYHFTTIALRYKEAKDVNGSMSLHLAVQLGRFKEAKGSSAHDRIYALLGLLDRAVHEEIDVNYEKPWWEVYIDVGRVSLTKSCHLEWLALCQSSWRPIGLLPSWCGNFMAENEATPFMYDSYFAGSLRPNESSTPDIQSRPASNRHLLLKGIIVGTVACVAKLSEKWDIEKGPLDGPSEHFRYALEWMSESLEMARTIPGMSLSAVPEDFLRTITADILVDGSTGYTYAQLSEMWESAQLVMVRIISKDHHAPLNRRAEALGYKFLDTIFNTCRFRRLFIVADQHTKKQRLSLGPDQVQMGDRVVVLKSARMPFVLRKNEQATFYSMVGPAYVQGRMMGQIPELVAGGKLQWEMVEIA